MDWLLTELGGYTSKWSAVQKYSEVNQKNPVDHFIKQLKPPWKGDRQTVNFPLFLRLGEV